MKCCMNIYRASAAQFAALLERYKFSHNHLAYISLLVDSYEFTSTCLERQIEDVNSLDNGAFSVLYSSLFMAQHNCLLYSVYFMHALCYGLRVRKDTPVILPLIL